MTAHCDWCGKECERVWQIPRASGRGPQWVCLPHYRKYKKGFVDADGEQTAKRADTL